MTRTRLTTALGFCAAAWAVVVVAAWWALPTSDAVAWWYLAWVAAATALCFGGVITQRPWLLLVSSGLFVGALMLAVLSIGVSLLPSAVLSLLSGVRMDRTPAPDA